MTCAPSHAVVDLVGVSLQHIDMARRAVGREVIQFNGQLFSISGDTSTAKEENTLIKERPLMHLYKGRPLKYLYNLLAL